MGKSTNTGIKLLLGILFIALVFDSYSSAVRVHGRKSNEEDSDEPEDEEELLSEEEDDLPHENMDLGTFNSFSHDVRSGEVTLIDDKTIYIRNFRYDGLGPAAWFVVGGGNKYTTQFVTLSDAIAIPDENETCDSLKRYRNENIRLKLPGDMVFSDYNYLSIYCLRFLENFGYVEIPDGKIKNGATPGPRKCPQTLVRDGRRLKYRTLRAFPAQNQTQRLLRK